MTLRANKSNLIFDILRVSYGLVHIWSFMAASPKQALTSTWASRKSAFFRRRPRRSIPSILHLGLNFRLHGDGKRLAPTLSTVRWNRSRPCFAPVILTPLLPLSRLPSDSSIYDYGCYHRRHILGGLEGLSKSFGRVKPDLQGCDSLMLDGSLLRLG